MENENKTVKSSAFIERVESAEEMEEAVNKQLRELGLDNPDIVKNGNSNEDPEEGSVVEQFKQTFGAEKSKVYLVMLWFSLEHHDWELCDTRQDAYDYIKTHIEEIDLVESFVLSSETMLKESINAGQFMLHMIDNDFIIDETSFDINDYLPDDFDVAD